MHLRQIFRTPAQPDVFGPLDTAKCEAMLRDPSHIFRRLWAAKPYAFRHRGQPTCFERSRDEEGNRPIDPRVFAEETRNGTHCDVNWYEGNEGLLGAAGRTPYFSNTIAPALFGFDESIDKFCTWERVHCQEDSKRYADWHTCTCTYTCTCTCTCTRTCPCPCPCTCTCIQVHYQDSKSYAQSHAGDCVNANHNILSLFGDRVPCMYACMPCICMYAMYMHACMYVYSLCNATKYRVRRVRCCDLDNDLDP